MFYILCNALYRPYTKDQIINIFVWIMAKEIGELERIIERALLVLFVGSLTTVVIFWIAKESLVKIFLRQTHYQFKKMSFCAHNLKIAILGHESFVRAENNILSGSFGKVYNQALFSHHQRLQG